MKTNIQLIAVLKTDNLRQDEFREFLNELTVLLLSEVGCRNCQVYESDQGTFFTLQYWESRELFEQFQARQGAALQSFLAEPIQVHYLVNISPAAPDAE